MTSIVVANTHTVPTGIQCNAQQPTCQLRECETGQTRTFRRWVLRVVDNHAAAAFENTGPTAALILGRMTSRMLNGESAPDIVETVGTWGAL